MEHNAISVKLLSDRLKAVLNISQDVFSALIFSGKMYTVD